ncbi:MAG: NUMOD4 domain-containing protein [Bacteroidota bacterium]
MDKENPTEEWKKIDFPEMASSEVYYISNFGRIKSFKGNKEGTIVNGSTLRGYRILTIKLKDNRNTTKYIHKLVAEAFIEREHEQQEHVIHLDYNKMNNKVSNLKWVTKKTMYEHHKLNPNYKKGHINNAKLTETEVIRLKLKLKRSKNKLYKIAKEFGITHTQLNRIRRGENWGHIDVNEE